MPHQTLKPGYGPDHKWYARAAPAKKGRGGGDFSSIW